MYADGILQRVHHVLNECAVDRGPHPSTLNLELYVDGEFITMVQVGSRELDVFACSIIRIFTFYFFIIYFMFVSALLFVSAHH